MADLRHLTNQQLADRIKDLVDNLNASRVVRDATITYPGGPPTAEAFAEYTQQEALIVPQIRQYIEIFLDPNRITNNVDTIIYNTGGTKNKNRNRNKNKNRNKSRKTKK
jgi:hypothetical protein